MTTVVSPTSSSNPIMAAAVRYGAPATPVYQLAWGLRLFSLGRSEERRGWYDQVCDDLEAILGKNRLGDLCIDLQDHFKANGLWGPRPLERYEVEHQRNVSERTTRAGRRLHVCRAVGEIIACISSVETEPAMRQLLTRQAENLRDLFLIENDGNHVRSKPAEVA